MISETGKGLQTPRPFLRWPVRDGLASAPQRDEWTDAHIPSRRCEARVHEAKRCIYSLCEPINPGQVVIQQGDAYCINRSRHGILVLMGDCPRENQLLEVHLPESQWRYSMNVYEVRWAKPLTIQAQGDLYLTGCQLLFRPPQYWKF